MPPLFILFDEGAVAVFSTGTLFVVGVIRLTGIVKLTSVEPNGNQKRNEQSLCRDPDLLVVGSFGSEDPKRRTREGRWRLKVLWTRASMLRNR
jgi:hypothetical protein